MSKPRVAEAQWLATPHPGQPLRVFPLVELLRVEERRRVWARLERLWAREQQGAS